MDERYRLGDLADLTNTAPRTIRYYIAEGLLPPPVGAGPAAVYTAEHRDRLVLIGRLKDAHHSLRDIRERLAALAADGVRATLGEGAGGADRAAASPAGPPAAAADRASATAGLPAGEQWERITLGEGIELHIRADRRREWAILDALIRQARGLLDGEQ